MSIPEISHMLANFQNEIAKIGNPVIRNIVLTLLDVIEELVSTVTQLRRENQELKDALNRLKGEQGKPDIKPNKPKRQNVSSEHERKEAERAADKASQREGFKWDRNSLEQLKEHRIPKEVLEQLSGLQKEKYAHETEFIQAITEALGKEAAGQYSAVLLKYARYRTRNRQAKLPKIQIDREEICPVNPAELPPDAEFKGYEAKVVQDLMIQSDNVKFKRETYYSPSLNTSYMGPIPLGYEGEFGPHINSQILTFKYVNNMSIPKIEEFYINVGIIISDSSMSQRLTQRIDVFHQEKQQLYQAGLELSPYQQIDDTTSHVNGHTCSTQIVCNPLLTVFFTTENKNRLTILDVVRQFAPRSFVFNAETVELLKQFKIPKGLIERLPGIETETVLTEQQMEAILQPLFPEPNKGARHRKRIYEATAIAAYHQERDVPVVKVLVCDDAPQFKLITDELALCWVHEARHYKRLQPVVPVHQELLEGFIEDFWNYYGRLMQYKQAPCADWAYVLSIEFDDLFSTHTGYPEWDERIEKTAAKKGELLTVLQHPELPLHNNMAENGARVQKRREDVSLQTKSKEGTQAKDTMMSIVETCKKLGVSAYHFICDRVSQRYEMPSLAELMRTKAHAHNK